MTMQRHFDLDLADLRQSLVAMGNVVDEALALANAGLAKPRVGLRAEAAAIEDRIDAMETAITIRCHELIVLQSPMTRDLRFMIAATRMVSTLEQIADLAESAARRAEYVATHSPIRIPDDVVVLGRLGRRMVAQAMTAFVAGDPVIAREILVEEKEADRLTKACHRQVQELMRAQPDLIPDYTHLVRAIAVLEQIADFAVVIAEEGIFVHSGRMARHDRDQAFGLDQVPPRPPSAG